jgi:hypothetical protein
MGKWTKNLLITHPPIRTHAMPYADRLSASLGKGNALCLNVSCCTFTVNYNVAVNLSTTHFIIFHSLSQETKLKPHKDLCWVLGERRDMDLIMDHT